MRIDYERMENGSKLVLWKRDKSGRRIRGEVTDLQPNFWVPAADMYTKVPKNLPFKGTDGVPLYKIFTKFPTDVPFERKRFSGHYQADVKFRDKYLIESDQDELAEWFDEGPPVVMFVDTEAVVVDGIYHLICYTYWDSNSQKFHSRLLALASKEKLDEVLRRYKDVKLYATTDLLLKAFIKDVVQVDPDIITGWNIHWDMHEVIWKLSKHLNANIEELSPDKIVTTTRARWGKRKIIIHGRDVFDLTRAMIKLTENKEKSYTLRYIAKKYLGIIKPDYRGKFKDLLKKDPVELLRYNRDVDVRAIVELDKMFRIIETFREAQKEFKCQLRTVFAVSEMIDMGLQRLTDLIRPSRGQRSHVDLVGPLNIKPAKGVHEGCVTVDFRGMYPSIMISFNMSPETLDPNGDLKVGNGVAFRSKPVGVIPKFLRKTLTLKEKYDGLMHRTKDSQLKWVYGVRRWFYKIVANATFGVTAWGPEEHSAGSGWYTPEIASSVFFISRKLLGGLIERLKKKKGLEVKYAHTDSMTIALGWGKNETPESFHAKCEELVAWITEELDGLAKELGLQHHEFRLGTDYEYEVLFLTDGHNRYSGFSLDGEFIEKGFTKSIFSRFAASFTRTLLQKVLRTGKVPENWIIDEVFRIKAGDIDPVDLCFLHTLRMPPTEYTRTNAFLRGITYSNAKLGMNLDYNETCMFLPVKNVELKGTNITRIALPLDWETFPPELDYLRKKMDLDAIINLNVKSRAREVFKAFEMDFKKFWRTLKNNVSNSDLRRYMR